MAVALSTNPFSLDVLTSTHGLLLDGDEWAVSSLIAFDHILGSWEEFAVELNASWAPIDAFAARADFAPTSATWESLAVKLGTSIGDVALDFEWRLVDCIDGASSRLRLIGNSGPLSLDMLVAYSGFFSEFSAFTGKAETSESACCELDAEGEISITCDGFEKALLKVQGIRVERLPWLSLSSELEFTLSEKRLELVPSIDVGTGTCLEFIAELDSSGGEMSPLSLGDLSIVGVRAECTIPGDVEVLSATALVDSANGELTGFTEYFEVMSLGTPLAGCCGVAGWVQFSVYYESSSVSLFDVGMLRGEIKAASDATQTFSVDVRYRPATASTSVRFSLGLQW